MSKAFTRDDDWEEPLVAPRAALPDGVPNYVTPRGLALLRSELSGLGRERQLLDVARSDEPEERRRLTILGRRLSELSARLASAELVDPRQQTHDAVRFGATAVVRTLDGARAGETRQLTIVGVDEADPAQGRVAFVAPIARAILGRAVGDTATLRTAHGDEELEIVAIEYRLD